jgi:hypothetical protein
LHYPLLVLVTSLCASGGFEPTFAAGRRERITGPELTSTPRTPSAFSLPSFAGGIAGVASGLPLGFHGGFPRCLLSEFRIAGLLLGFQRGLTSSSLGDLRSG